MYLKLGTIGIKYTKDVNDYIILSEVLRSGISYETPILLSSPSELDIWFGKDFEYRDYYINLLNQKLTLYLYRPVSTEITKAEDYVDLANYTAYNDEDSKLPLSLFPYPKVLSETDKYSAMVVNSWYIWQTNQWVPYESTTHGDINLYTSQGVYQDTQSLPELPKFDYKYLEIDGYWRVWKYNGWFSEENFIPSVSSSLNNRDTLLITRPKKEIETVSYNYDYCYPEFDNNTSGLGVFSRGAYSKTYNPQTTIDQEAILDGRKTLVTRFKFQNSSFEDTDGFILFKKTTGTDVLFKTQGYETPAWVKSGTPEEIIVSISELKTKLSSVCGWFVESTAEEKEFLVYSGDIMDCTYAYEFPGAEITPSFEDSHNMLTFYTTSNNIACLGMWSRTIGHTTDRFDEDCDINVLIEKSTSEGYYRITLSRYSYSETFEGPIRPTPGEEERLDHTISKNSKLVYCEFYNTAEGIKPGNYTLRRAKTETYETDNYKKGLEVLLDQTGESIYPDYFFVPDINKYSTGIDNGYYDIYDTFLRYAKELNCQFLIQNTPSEYKIVEVEEYPDSPEKNIIYNKGSEFKWIKNGSFVVMDLSKTEEKKIYNIALWNGDNAYNLIEPENRLIYFYDTMTYYKYKRPGWFIYLEGLFKDIYSMSVDYIYYKSPVSNPYSEEDIEKNLEKCKSNYMVCNNHIYYYKKYFNGETFTTSGLMRFIIGKVFRELQKNRWYLLSQREIGKVRENLGTIINRIGSNFSIVKSIRVSSFVPDMKTNSLNLTIETKVKDLVDNNITLDITINYNKYE